MNTEDLFRSVFEIRRRCAKYGDNTIEGEYGSYNNVSFLEDNYEKEIYVESELDTQYLNKGGIKNDN